MILFSLVRAAAVVIITDIDGFHDHRRLFWDAFRPVISITVNDLCTIVDVILRVLIVNTQLVTPCSEIFCVRRAGSELLGVLPVEAIKDILGDFLSGSKRSVISTTDHNQG